jgi:hypothetical protein
MRNLILKIFIISVFIVTLTSLPSCQGMQSSRIIGIWEMSHMDRLPLGLPRTQWEFTADNKLNVYVLPENNIRVLRGTGQYSFTKNGRFEVVKFQASYNGEWIIVKLNNRVLRIVLKEFVDDKPAGQTLFEFTKVF